MTYRLVQIALARWDDMEGLRVSQGATTSLGSLSVEQLASYAWWYVTNGGEDTEIEKFKARLWRPPVGVKPERDSPWSAQNEMAAFAAVKSKVGK